MSKQEFLNFKEISSFIKFEDVLNWLNIPFMKTDKELKGDGFIVNIEKNLFFATKDENLKGSVINFLASHENIDLREAASKLKIHFLSKDENKTKKNIPILSLQHHNYLIERGVKREIAELYEVGYVKQRSILTGRIAFKVYDHSGNLTGYIGYKIEDGTWFFPKGFKRTLYNANKITNNEFVIVTTDPFDTLRIISLGINEVVCLLANSMTSEQEEELKRFKKVLLLHREPQNIVGRLCNTAFIKAHVLLKQLQEMSDHDLMNILNF